MSDSIKEMMNILNINEVDNSKVSEKIDEKCSQYLSLKKKIDSLTKELDGLKEEIKLFGNVQTEKHIVQITSTSQTRVAGLEKFKNAGFDDEWLKNKNLLTTSTFDKLTVKECK